MSSSVSVSVAPRIASSGSALSTQHSALLRELVWLVPFALLVLALCGLPYLVADRYGPRDLERTGTFWFGRDFGQYHAAMREGAASDSWLIHNRYTAEPHEPVLMYPLYVGLGKLAAATSVDQEAAFGALEWLSRVILLGALYGFAATFLSTAKERRLTLLLALGTLGLAGWAIPLRVFQDVAGAGVPTGSLSAASVYLEINTLGVFLSAPHLMLGLALTLLVAPIYLRARSGNRRWLAALAVVVAGLSVVHQFNLPVLVSVLGAEAAMAVARGPFPVPSVRERLRPLLAPLVAGLAAAPLALYNLLLFQLDPFWAGTYGVQNEMPASPLWALPIDFGILLLAAPAAWGVLRAWPAERRRLLLLWVGLGLLWWYAPVPYQRRFAFGVQPGLALLAAVGLLAINRWMRERRWPLAPRATFNLGVTLAALVTPLLIYLSLLASSVANAPLEVYLWSRTEANAARWLGERSTRDDVVLAHTLFANPLVGFVDGRVVHGHIVATRESDAKEQLLQRFYAPDASVEERSSLLRESGATVVALGPRERALGAGDLSNQPELELVYDRDGVQWYRLRT